MRSSRFFWAAYVLCASAALLPLLVTKYLPMVDLPHHAAQVSILRHYTDPVYGFEDQFRINWFTPYAFAYYIAWLFSFLLPVVYAMKVVVALTILALPLSIWFLLKQSGGDPWWSLLGFPISFGYSFVWGLFNYLVAVPVGVLCIAYGFVYAYHPTKRNGYVLTGLTLLTFFSHAIVFALALAINIAVVMTLSTRFIPYHMRVLPLLLPIPLVLYWYWSPTKNVPHIDSHIQWDSGGWWFRLYEFTANLISVEKDAQARKIGAGMLVGLLVGSLPGVSVKRFLPFLIAFGAYYLGPFYFLGHSCIYPRIAVLAFVGLLVALRPSPMKLFFYAGRGLQIFFILFWLSILTVRFYGFHNEAIKFDDVTASMKPNRSLLALVYDRASEYVPCEPFYHFGAWYQAEKGGKLGYSIAYLYNVVAQYKPDRAPLPLGLASKVWTWPWTMNWEEYGHFDYYLVRSREGLPIFFQQDLKEKLELEASSETWWLFQNKSEKAGVTKS